MESSRPSFAAPARRLSPWLPLGMGVLGVLVRLRFPAVEDEAMPAKKAFEMWDWGAGHLSLDPQTAGWPSLSFYAHLLLQHLQYWVGRWTGAYADRLDYFVAARLDPEIVLRPARALSAIAAGVVIWAAARLAGRLTGRAGALLSGALLVVSPMLVDHSLLVTPDILVAAFVALAVDRLVAFHERGRIADSLWAGVWIGLGISTKYTPVLMLPALFVAHLARGGVDPPSRPASWLDRGPWMGFAAAIVAFVATSPYLVLDLGTLARDVAGQTLHMTGGHFGGGAKPGLIFYFFDVLGPGLGWTGLLTCLVGLAWGSMSPRSAWWVLIACVAPYYLGAALLKTQFPRYVLPLLMPLAVGASALVPRLRVLPWSRSRAVSTALVALVIVIAVVPAAITSGQKYVAESRPTTHQLASEFLREAAGPGGRHIAAEVLSVTLRTARDTEVLDPNVLQRLSPRQRARLEAQPRVELTRIPMYAVRPELSRFYYDLRHYIAEDFIVVSQAVRGRYLESADRFPAQVLFYADLDRYGRRVRRFGPEQGRGAEIDIYRLPDGGAALLRDRGAMQVDPVRASSVSLSMRDLVPFAEGVANGALSKRRWAMAARYEDLVLAAGARSGVDPAELAALEKQVSALRARAAADSAGSRVRTRR